MSENIDTSIIICTYNRAADLEQTLASLYDVSLPLSATAELIVVDNGSTDGTVDVVASFHRPALPVRYVYEPRRGKGNAYNAGIAVARGTVLLFSDDDVRFPSNWIEDMSRPILSGETDAIAGGVRIARHLDRPWMQPLHRLWMAHSELLSDETFEMIGANMAFGRHILSKVPAFDPELGPGALGLGDDSLIHHQILRAGYRIQLREKIAVEHHFDPRRLTRSEFLRRAEAMGRTHAYVAHHWQHKDVSLLSLRFLKAAILLGWHRGCSTLLGNVEEQGVAIRELVRVSGFHFYRQYRRERQRPRNYERNGLVKLQHYPPRMPSSSGLPSPRPRVAIVCSGMDKVKRGFEAHARDLFELLRDDDRLDLTLIKGSGVERPREKVIFNLHRESAANGVLCRFFGESRRWYIEFMSFSIGLLPLLFQKKFDTFYVSEATLYRFLRWWRHVSRQHYALIHATGGWFEPNAPVRVLRSATGRIIPPTDADYLHHVNPFYVAAAESCGFRRENQFIIPHLFDTRTPQSIAGANLSELRDELGIPPDMPVLLSVGSIDRSHKRMDYVIEEAANVFPPVFVLLVGDQNPESPALRNLAMRKLGLGRFAITKVARVDIFKYYALADVFVLASLREAFGIVFIEALMAGLPVIAHDYDVSRYVLGEHAYFADLSVVGGLANTLRTILSACQTSAMKRARIEYVTRKYDAQTLKAQYQHMFLSACVGASQKRTSESATMNTQRT